MSRTRVRRLTWIAFAGVFALAVTASPQSERASAEAAPATPPVKVTGTLTVKNLRGYHYVGLPSSKARLAMHVVVRNDSNSATGQPSADLHGLKLTLTFAGLKLDAKPVDNVTPSADRQSATWTIDELKAGRTAERTIKGDTPTIGVATFTITTPTDATATTPINQSINLLPATGILKLDPLKNGKLHSFTTRTFHGTFASATCDPRVEGEVRLTGEYPSGRRPPYKIKRRRTPKPAVFVRPKSAVSGPCPFKADVRFKNLKGFRGRTFRFMARSARTGEHSDKVRVGVARDA